MPRSSALRNEIHDKIREGLAFFLNHVLVNHLCGLEMGILVLRYIIGRLKDLRGIVEREIELLLVDEEEGFEDDSSSSYLSDDEPPQDVEP